MKKVLLLACMAGLFSVSGFSQHSKSWSVSPESRSSIITDKAVSRQSYPKEFKLFTLDLQSFRQELFSIVDNNSGRGQQ